MKCVTVGAIAIVFFSYLLFAARAGESKTQSIETW
jgi:hypothetical protein